MAVKEQVSDSTKSSLTRKDYLDMGYKEPHYNEVVQDFKELVTFLFNEVKDVDTFCQLFVTIFTNYQYRTFNRLNTMQMLENKGACCSSSALTMGIWWERQQPGNQVIYFIQGGEDPKISHVMFALIPAGFDINCIEDEFSKHMDDIKNEREVPTTPVKFYHYDRFTDEKSGEIAEITLGPIGNKTRLDFNLDTWCIGTERFMQNRYGHLKPIKGA